MFFSSNLKRLFRKYHRGLASIIFIPLILTVVTGTIATIVTEWQLNLGVSRSLLMEIHTGEIFHLKAIYPVLNGVGTLGLLITGITMTGLFNRKKNYID
ncbi:hypothetical protein [Chamaesiphon minutus]|uniref:Peptidase n=1 Tax=Chamaesiphon minutus (strain ATCC 27169 / PCC 6605) TaxID=1173020 RepID=K9UEB4_CHAP6|nr:hypothetical protein [Chamaesiphon minutus]AFY92983.1 hypothetical protein Cha6605_1872 [Chamaesiphon minutus PCC 6605]